MLLWPLKMLSFNFCNALDWTGLDITGTMVDLPDTMHIVPCGKFHRIGGAPPKTFPNVKYDAPEEVGGDRKCFDSPIRKLGLI